MNNPVGTHPMRRFTEREYNLAVERCEALIQFSFLDFHIEYGCTEDDFVFVSVVFFSADGVDILGDEYYWLSSPERAVKIRNISLDVYNLSEMGFVSFRYNKNWDPLVLPVQQPKSRPSKRMRDNKPHRYDVAGYPEPEKIVYQDKSKKWEAIEQASTGQEAAERVAAERFIANHNKLIVEQKSE